MILNFPFSINNQIYVFINSITIKIWTMDGFQIQRMRSFDIKDYLLRY